MPDRAGATAEFSHNKTRAEIKRFWVAFVSVPAIKIDGDSSTAASTPDHLHRCLLDDFAPCLRRSFALGPAQCRSDSDALFVGRNNTRIHIRAPSHRRGIA